MSESENPILMLLMERTEFFLLYYDLILLSVQKIVSLPSIHVKSFRGLYNYKVQLKKQNGCCFDG